MELSIVAAVYNNREQLPAFVGGVRQALDAHNVDWELVLADDASSDSSADWIAEENSRDSRVKLLGLDENVGQHNALLAGLSYTRGCFVVLMDADCEEPANYLPRLLDAIRAPSAPDLIVGVMPQRPMNSLRDWGARAFEWTVRLMMKDPPPANALMMRIMTRRFAQGLLLTPRPEIPFLGALCQQQPYPKATLPIPKSRRKTSGYSLKSRAEVALNALKTLNLWPLKLFLGLGYALMAFFITMLLSHLYFLVYDDSYNLSIWRLPLFLLSILYIVYTLNQKLKSYIRKPFILNEPVWMAKWVVGLEGDPVLETYGTKDSNGAPLPFDYSKIEDYLEDEEANADDEDVPTLFWERRGLVLTPEPGRFAWMQSHASVPVVEPLEGSHIRLYFSTRDAMGRSHTAAVCLDMEDPQNSLVWEHEPVLSPGPAGRFDAYGAMACDFFHWQGQDYLLYVGWQRGRDVPFVNALGYAMRVDGHWQACEQPLLACSELSPAFVASACALPQADGIVLVYTSGQEWYKAADGSLLPNYGIRNAFLRGSSTKLEELSQELSHIGPLPKDTVPSCASRPSVFLLGDRRYLAYCYREPLGQAEYRIQFMESYGEYWLPFAQPSFGPSKDAWENRATCYPCVYPYEGKLFMFYNGNDYGRTGIGLAVGELAENLTIEAS